MTPTLASGALTLALAVAIPAAGGCQSGAPAPGAPEKLGEKKTVVTPTKRAKRTPNSPFRNPSREPPPPRSGEQLDAETLEATIVKGRELAAADDHVSAMREFRKCANKITPSPRCEGELGLLLVSKRQRQGFALFYLKESVSQPDPKADADFYRRVGEALQSRGKVEDASKAYTFLVEREPDKAENFALLSRALQGVPAKRKEAADALTKARELNPDNGPNWDEELKWMYEEGIVRAQVAGQAAQAKDLLAEYVEKTAGEDPELEEVLRSRIAELEGIAAMEDSGKPDGKATKGKKAKDAEKAGERPAVIQ